MEATTPCKKALYYLKFTKEKLNSESLQKLKCILCYLIRKGIVSENLALETHIIGEGVESFKTDYQLILKMLFNIYNLVTIPLIVNVLIA